MAWSGKAGRNKWHTEWWKSRRKGHQVLKGGEDKIRFRDVRTMASGCELDSTGFRSVNRWRLLWRRKRHVCFYLLVPACLYLWCLLCAVLTGKALGRMSRNARSECWVSCRSPAERAAIFFNPEPKCFLPSLFSLFPVNHILTEPRHQCVSYVKFLTETCRVISMKPAYQMPCPSVLQMAVLRVDLPLFLQC